MMKKIYLVIITIITSILSFGQNIPNGGFEVWDTLYIPENPSNWVFLEINTPCVPLIYPAERTTDSHTGNFAVKLESKVCVDDLGNDRLAEGWIQTGNYGGGAPDSWSIEYYERPENLNFYYKFHQEGNDSAYVRILLFNYDSITPGLSSIDRVDTIAFSSGYINEEADEYTQFELPINYYSETDHEFVHILFSTSKTLSEGYGNTPPFLYAYPETTLIIDDVSVSGGTVSISSIEIEPFQIEIYPNPTNSIFHIKTDDLMDIESISIFHFSGRRVKGWKEHQEEFNIANLQAGIYFVRVQTDSGIVIKKMIKR